METLQNPFVFISIFYAQEKWHDLLPVVRNELYGHQEISGQISESYVFFSSYRGSNIRIALKYKNPIMKKTFERVVKPINAFLEDNPSNSQSVLPPITSFFADFPNNQIKYNLYNERVIMPGELPTFQLVLSNILLTFFDDHPVDDDALFTLVVSLQEALLNALCDTNESKHDLISILIAEIKRRNMNPPPGIVELKNFEILPNTEELNGIAGIDKLLHWFEKAANMLYTKSGSKMVTYFTIVQIIQLHLFKIYYEIFLDSLEYLADLSQSESSGIYNEETSYMSALNNKSYKQ